jgi:hypothetical protein
VIDSETDPRGSRAHSEKPSRPHPRSSCLNASGLTERKGSCETSSSGCEAEPESLPVDVNHQQRKPEKGSIFASSSTLRPPVSPKPIPLSRSSHGSVKPDDSRVHQEEQKPQEQNKITNVSGIIEEDPGTSPVIDNSTQAICQARSGVDTRHFPHISIGSDAPSARCVFSDPHAQTITEYNKSTHFSGALCEQSKEHRYVATSPPNNTCEIGSKAPRLSTPLSRNSAEQGSGQDSHKCSRSKEATDHTIDSPAHGGSQSCSSDSRPSPAARENGNPLRSYRLNNLVAALELREPDSSTIAAPLNPGYAYGKDSLISSSQIHTSREKASSGSTYTSKFSNQASEYTFKANEGSNQDRVNTKLAPKPPNTSHLRCPYYFSGDEHPCQFHQRFPRDIM